jgi:polar amino acid transport system substrate-binding protein
MADTMQFVQTDSCDVAILVCLGLAASMARTLIVAVAALATVATACGDDSDATSDAGTDCNTLPTVQEGVLTVATGETVFPPWMGAGEDDFDDPTTGTGYEGALVYALAAELGFDAGDVTFVRTGFDEVIAPGEKDWDFNIQQYSITAARDEVVDFSDGYYQVEQAIIGRADGPAAGASTLDDLRSVRVGAALGTTSLDYAESVIAPDSDVQVYDDNAAAKAAFDAGQVDAIVFDLPTAYYITAVEITDASIIGVLPRSDDAPEELGMLFEEGNPLVSCVNSALTALRDGGTLAAIEDEWLNQGGSIPSITD